ncbi:MAG: hypothetical protein V1859_09710 [archaeon]
MVIDLQTERLDIARQIYNGLVAHAVDGTRPNDAQLQEILLREMALWQAHSPLWIAHQKTDFAKADVLGQQIIPGTDEMLRVPEQRAQLYYGEKPTFVLASSGTTSAQRAIVQADPIVAALLGAAVSASISDTLRATGHGNYCLSLQFPTFEQAVEHYRAGPANPTLLVPQSTLAKPFGTVINGFPAPYAGDSYAKVPTHMMYVVHGGKLLGDLAGDSQFYPVINTAGQDGGKVFDMQMQQVADYLTNRGDKPVFMQIPTPYHPVIMNLMGNGILSELQDGDLVWSAGGDKAGKGLLVPTGLENRLGSHVNLLGDTTNSTQGYSNVQPASGIVTPEWLRFNDSHLFTITTPYDFMEGNVPEGNRMVLDLIHGLSFPALLYSADRIATVDGGYQMLGR